MAKHQFQTEIGQLLQLMTHSLYSNKEIFIRELISNASDALDKFNYIRLTDEAFKEEEWTGKISIVIDKDDGSITIGDNGIGMSEEDLMSHLGTIAKSGTKSFVENLTGDAKKDSHLIGQFGVGFYSVFMVAQRVDVITKKAGDTQAYKFVSDGTGEFDITPVTKESHGTVVYIKLKDDEKEYLSRWRIQEVVKKYSNHIAYPIMLTYTEEETTGEGDAKETKSVEKIDQINAATALWTLSKSDIKNEEYVEFYKTISHDSDEPLDYLHHKVEGANEFTTLFYIPRNAPMDLYRVDYQSGVKLYVKRVFITDEDKELLPSYLRFVRGIIDSEDLPLNISREILQENRILANIKQNSVKKILSSIKKLDDEKFEIFTAQYNKVIKEGIFQDHTNKETLLEIVRYKTTKAEGMTSLEEYLKRAGERAGETQKEIYYIIGEDAALLGRSPLLEAYRKADIEVLIMDDKEIDEIVTPSIGNYKEWQFKDVTMTDAPDTITEEEKKEISKAHETLTGKIKEILGDEVKEVKTTTRLTDSPSCVVKDSSDPMASMAYMFRQMGQKVPETPLILEINPEHEMIKKLEVLGDDALFDDMAWILLDSAKLAEGLEPKDRVLFVSRVTKVAGKAL
jgi:molecular chaperone HtpG